MKRPILASVMLALALAALPPAARAEVVLYDGSLNTTPGAQGWFYVADPINGGLATQTAAGGVTTLSTLATNAIQAGYFTQNPITNQVLAGMPTLDRAAGYTVQFDVKVNAEAHASTNRAGFSLIALSSDSRGIELGFWEDEVWAQNDNPLFTHGEGAAFDTTQGVVRYQLSVLGGAYELYAGGSLLLTGALRDYTASPIPIYSYQNFLFLGDDTSSARASIDLARVSVLPTAVPEPSTMALGVLGGLAAVGYGRRQRVGRPS